MTVRLDSESRNLPKSTRAVSSRLLETRFLAYLYFATLGTRLAVSYTIYLKAAPAAFEENLVKRLVLLVGGSLHLIRLNICTRLFPRSAMKTSPFSLMHT